MKLHSIFKKSPILLSLAFLLLACPTGYADDEEKDKEEVLCIRPGDTPSVPDARRASESEMKEAMKAVREYLAKSTEFRGCVSALLHQEDEKSSESVKKAAVYMIQETLETEELLADLFNQQIRIYKQINPD
jgi:hypothetical protein